MVTIENTLDSITNVEQMLVKNPLENILDMEQKKVKKIKIVDFKLLNSTSDHHGSIFALSEDGTLYGMPINKGFESKWIKLPALPQD